MNVILYAAGLALMILGAVELIRRLCFWAHNLGAVPEETGKMALLVFPSGSEDCEDLVRVAGERVQWMALKPPCRFICVDCGSEEARRIVERLSLRYKGLELVKPEELPEILGGK